MKTWLLALVLVPLLASAQDRTRGERPGHDHGPGGDRPGFGGGRPGGPIGPIGPGGPIGGGAGEVNFRARRATRNLIEAVDQLDKDAFERADMLNSRGGENTPGIRELDATSDAAANLSRAIRRQIWREMHDRDGHDRFGRTMKRIHDNELTILERAVEELNRGGHGIKMAFDSIHTQWHNLEEAIEQDHQGHGGGGHGGGGLGLPVSGSCTGKFGGNFFNKASHVECLVSGMGLDRYEVEFANGQSGQRQTVQGTLDGRQGRQSFVSPKANVGAFANYTVFVVTRRGDRVQIAQGRCEGKPF